MALKNRFFQPSRRVDVLVSFSDFKSRAQTFLCPQSMAHRSFLCYDSSPMDLKGATLSFFFQLSAIAETLLNGPQGTLYIYIEHSSTCAVIYNTSQRYVSKIFF